MDPNDRNFRTFSPKKHNFWDFLPLITYKTLNYNLNSLAKFSRLHRQVNGRGELKFNYMYATEGERVGTGIAALASRFFFSFLRSEGPREARIEGFCCGRVR